jgi:hypothetical protein
VISESHNHFPKGKLFDYKPFFLSFGPSVDGRSPVRSRPDHPLTWSHFPDAQISAAACQIPATANEVLTV